MIKKDETLLKVQLYFHCNELIEQHRAGECEDKTDLIIRERMVFICWA